MQIEIERSDPLWTSIDFRVSGLPHAVELWNKPEFSCSWTREEDRAMKSHLSYARKFLKCNAQSALFTGIKASFTALVGISPADVSTDGNWIFSQSRTMSSRMDDLMAIVMEKMKHKTRTSSPMMWESDASKKVLKELTTASRKISKNRDSQLRIDRTEEVCIQMDKDAQKDVTYRLSSEEYERYKKTWSFSLNTSGRNTPMKLRSDFSEAWTKMHRLHRESEDERLAPIPLWQYQKWHSSSSSSSTSWWQWNDHWWSSQNSSKSSTSEIVTWAASQNKATCWSGFFTELLRVTLWQVYSFFIVAVKSR